MSTITFSIHEYPDNTDPITLAAYKAAVVQAAKSGQPLEHRAYNAEDWHAIDVNAISWTWDFCDYRIARPVERKDDK